MPNLIISKRPLSIHQKAITATLIGNGFEWFDFTCYLFFTVIISKLFFPAQNELNSLLLTLATFGVGFVVRPASGILMGIYADKVGRKQALWLTMLMMTLGTGLIGLAPTYDQIGLWAPLLIIVSRLLQGFAAGAEMSSASTFLMEYAPEGKKGYYTSLIQAGVAVAILLGASAATFLTHYLNTDDLYGWGWRLPFLFGMFLGPVGLYIRHRVVDPPGIVQRKRASTPLRDVVRLHPREICVSFSLVVLWTICTYVLLFYIPTYSINVLHLPASTGLIAIILGSILVLIFAPIFGALSDRLGQKPLLVFSATGILILTYPLFWLINEFPGLPSLLLFQFVFGVLIACYEGPILAAMLDLFPKDIVSTGIALSHSLAVTIFGGFAAFIITWLMSVTENQLAPAIYVMIGSLISLIAAMCIGTKKNILSKTMQFQG
jgi:MFS transporter, MHS family, proline/betaine transporter